MGHQQGFLVFIIYFLRSCQVSRSIGLTIDNQLVIIANDCYTRVAIGSKLPDMDIFSNVSVRSISECEDECSKMRNSCNSFAFGIGMKGNGTCALSMKMPKPEDLQSHADYDVYVRSQRSPHCEPDRLYKMGSGSIGQGRRNETMPPTTMFGSGLLGSTMPNGLSSPRTIGNMPNVNNNPRGPMFQGGFVPSFDDERRILDIVRNKNPTSPTSNPFGTNNAKVDNYDPSINTNRKPGFGQKTHPDPKYSRPNFGGPPYQNPFAGINQLNFGLDSDLHSYKALTIHNGPFDVFSRPLYVYDGMSKNRPPADFGFWNDHDITRHRTTNNLNQHRHQEFLNNVYKSQGIITKQNELLAGNYDVRKISPRPTVNNYGYETTRPKISNGGFKDTSELWPPGLLTMFNNFGTRIIEKPKSCYRRLLSGKKSLDLHVRRAIECERLEDCHRACDYEKRFTCEGFNYRRIGHELRGMCEMTSVPYSHMDFHRDFESDPQCDYYEKDPNCVINPPETRPSWWNQPSKPGPSYGPPYSPNERPDTRPYAPDRRPLNEVPRPLDYDRRPLKEIPRPFDFDRRPSNEIPRPLDYAPRPAEYDRRPPITYGSYSHRGPYDDMFDRRNYPDDSTRGGYPARPEDRFTYSVRYSPRRPDDDFYSRNPSWTRYPNRRIDHDIGTNEIGSYLPDHRKNPNRDWGSYGVYGGSYGYDTNYVGKFDVPKYYPKSPSKSSRPYESDQFYGEFYNYGGAFGYGDNYIPANQDTLYGGSGRSEECSVRAGAGFRLSRGVVRKTYLTANLDQCENLCISEKSYVCMSFSYRYNVAPTDPTDNCLLSDVSYKDLNFYIDLEPDRDYDIYAMVTNSRTCGTKREPSSTPPDECFWRVRSGFGMPTDVVRKSLIVHNLGDCQAECMLMQDFMCRSFTFKYGLEQRRSDVPTNCYLSDWPSQDINPALMPDMDGAELYERGSFGRGCEPYAVPFFNMGQFTGKQSSQRDEACYSGYNKPCKLTPYVVLLATFVNSEQDCRQKCSKMRETDSVPCMSFSYKLTTHGTEENCLLSDVPIRDLRPGLDYTHDNDHILYAWKDLDPYCMTGYSLDDDHVFSGVSPLKPLPDHSRPDFSFGRYPNTRPDDNYPESRPFFTKPGGYGVKPYDPDRPDPIRPYPPGGYGSYGDKFGYGIRPGGHGSLYPDEYSTFRYYTVNGYPCKRGTKCEKNKIAGFWACEIEGGFFDSWDYCCAPTHHCGFSQGYHYPWCHVGLSEDQWRPCSENYFPYLPSPRPIRPTVGEDRYDRPYDPGYYGRHWPITYLHREPPPNCTDSLASADNSGNRRSNGTISTTIKPPSSTTTVKSNENSTTNASKTRRRRLRVRTVNNTRNDRNAISPQKVGGRIIVNNATRIRENQMTWDRAGKIERVSRPTNTEPSLSAPFVTTNYVENAKNSDEMIKVPLIAPKN